MSTDTCNVVVSRDVALLLTEILIRCSNDGAIRPCDSAEKRALSDLSMAIVTALPEPGLDHLDQIGAARARLATPGSQSISRPPLVVYVDVDDTLVRSVGSERIPMQGMIDRVRELSSIGVELYCWSSRGSDYAHHSAIELGIAGCFLSFLPKPMLLIDNQSVAEWRGFRYLHPNEAASRSLNELASAEGTAPG